MERISELMDGEFGEQESRLEIRRLEHDEGLIQAWATYHLIRDVLRDEAGVGTGLAARVCERLQHEPTVLAPRARFAASALNRPLRIAAAVAGVGVVAWIALSSQLHQSTIKTAEIVPPKPPIAIVDPAPPPPLLAKGEVNKYLLAHQEFSPTTAMQGVGSYSRTVWNEDSDPPR
jgi:sigma-E factor negative regulatory protein RseA